MNAAIYARKSTEQNGVADEAKSVTRQVENAKAYAARKGWTVAAEHIFVDDGISGAEFERRPGLSQLRNKLGRRAPFQVLVVSEQKSIGRESVETGYVIKQLAQAGVEVFEYVHGRSLTPKNAMEKAMGALQGFGDETHREQTSERVHETHTRLANAGHVTGGRVFGYRNQDVFNGVDIHGRPLRSHVERVIDIPEADVVRRIFALYDSGLGFKAIVKRLKSEGAVTPKPFARNDGLQPVAGWSAGVVRNILSREVYHGIVVWNKTRKKNSLTGKLDPQDRPESEWIRATCEQLRIIDESLWRRVQARRKEAEGRTLRFDDGRLCGRPPKHATRNLLAGLATCGVCGGGLVVEHSNKGSHQYAYYTCHRHRHFSGCTNALRMPLEDMNEAVLRAIEEHALTPEAVEQIIRLTERDDAREQQEALSRERRDIEKRIGRLVAAVETAGDVASLAAKLRELEARRNAIDGELRGLHPVPRLAPAVIEDRLAEWRRLLRQSTTQGRAVLQRVLRGRLTFTPREDGQGYDFSGPTRFDRLFTGIVVQLPSWVTKGDVRGTEHIQPEDTFDGDYGRLLEQAVYGKGVARPAGLEPATSWFVARRSIQLS
jgi:site-specific DNA recombinase